MKLAAAAAHVQWVDPNAPGKPYSWIGHDICAKSSWVIRVANHHFLTASFHPTATGQYELEQALLANM